MKCTTCAGQGTIKCPRCNGAGSVDCPMCESGSYIQYVTVNGDGECIKCNDFGSIDCPNCKGEGMITCPTCHQGNKKLKKGTSIKTSSYSIHVNDEGIVSTSGDIDAINGFKITGNSIIINSSETIKSNFMKEFNYTLKDIMDNKIEYSNPSSYQHKSLDMKCDYKSYTTNKIEELDEDFCDDLEQDINGLFNEDVYGDLNGNIVGVMNGDIYGDLNGDIVGIMNGEISGVHNKNIKEKL